MKKFLGGLFVAAMVIFVLPATSSAQVSADVQAQLSIIASLTQQIQALQAQMQQLQGQRTGAVIKLLSTLNQGAEGDEVTKLQTILAADLDVYPEGRITGYFGPLTAKAVRNFQKKNGLEQVGRVGPKTLQKLNEMLDKHPLAEEDDDDDTHSVKIRASSTPDGVKRDKKLCAVVPPGHLIAPGWLKQHDGVRPIIPPCQTLPPGIWNKLPGYRMPTTIPSPSVSPSVSPSTSPSSTSSPQATASPTPSATPTATPTVTPTATPSPTPSP